MTRTYWLSFCDPDRPRGQQFLGVCIVDVGEREAAAAAAHLARQPHLRQSEEGAWLGAAMRKAHALGINPGGAVGGIVVPPEMADTIANLPKHTLIDRATLEADGRGATR